MPAPANPTGGRGHTRTPAAAASSSHGGLDDSQAFLPDSSDSDAFLLTRRALDQQQQQQQQRVSGGQGGGGDIPTRRRGVASYAANSSAYEAARLERAVCGALLPIPVVTTAVWHIPADQLAAATGMTGLAALASVVLGMSLPAAVAEYTQRSGWVAQAALLVALGSLCGYLCELLIPLGLVRIGAMLAVGYCAGRVRFLWYTRRLSRRMPHSFGSRFSNIVQRTTGLAWLMVMAETVACTLSVPGGWLLVSQSWYGYLLLMLFPFLLVPFFSGVASLLSRLFGGDRRHVIGGTRMERVRWAVAVCAATTAFACSMLSLFYWYGEYTLQQQLLVSPYAAFGEILAYRAHKAKSRRAREPPLFGKDVYKQFSRKHDQLIDEVMRRKHEFCR